MHSYKSRTAMVREPGRADITGRTFITSGQRYRSLLLLSCAWLAACGSDRPGFEGNSETNAQLDAGGVADDESASDSDNSALTSTDAATTAGETETESESSDDPGTSTEPATDDAGTDSTSETAPESGTCTPHDERPCEQALGACSAGVELCAEDGQSWGECDVQPSVDTCEPGNDADCDGEPNEGCDCVDDAERPCEGALGACASGTQTCTDGVWDECSVQPEAADACDVPADDSNCDGVPNGGCTCTADDTQDCGSETDVGACEIGTSTCMDSVWGECVGAIPPAARDCTSSEDNDCDGEPDNTQDDTCECAPGTSEACEPHPGQDGNGLCQAGTRECSAAPGNASSSWGECVGAQGPQARDCSSSADNDCDGEPDNSIDTACTCVVDTEQDCGVEAGSNGCRIGTQTCEAGDDSTSSDWGECEYEDAPDDTACDDGDPASLDDACNDGVCLGEYDETAPTVTTFLPAAEAVGVQTNSVIDVTFSEAVAAATVSASSFLVTGPEGAIAGTLSFPTPSQVRFTPSAQLGLLREYTVTITPVVEDLAGNPLAQARSASFTTRDGVWGAATLLESDDTGDASAPLLAVSKGGNATVIWKYGTDDALKARRYSSGTWASVDNLEAADVYATRVAIDDNGNGLAIWTVPGNLYWRSFTSSAWGTRTSIFTSPGVEKLGFGMDASGRALLNWINPADSYQVVSSYYSGTSWSSAIDFPGVVQTSYVIEVGEREVLFGSDGQALATWWEYDDDGWVTKTTRYNPTSGWASTSGYVGAISNAHVKLAGDPATTAVAVWTQGSNIYANRYISGAWGTSSETLESASGAAGQSQVAMAPSGEGIAVWSQTDGTRYNIYHRRFSGGVWIGTASTLESLNAAATNPQIAMDVAGNGLALWEQGSATSVYAARYNAGTTTWSGGSSPIESGTGAATQIQIGFDRMGRAIAVWTQANSGGTRTDIYYARFE